MKRAKPEKNEGEAGDQTELTVRLAHRGSSSNNPVVLPCIRIRDVAMMGLMSVTGGAYGL